MCDLSSRGCSILMHFAKLTCDASEYVGWTFRVVKEWNRMAKTTIISVQDVSKIFSGQGEKRKTTLTWIFLIFDLRQPPPFFSPLPKENKTKLNQEPPNAQYWQLQQIFVSPRNPSETPKVCWNLWPGSIWSSRFGEVAHGTRYWLSIFESWLCISVTKGFLRFVLRVICCFFFRMKIFRYTSRCCGFFRNHVPLMYKQNPCKILPKPCKIHGYIIYHPIQNQALTLTVSFSHYTSTKFRFITVYGSQWPLGFSSTLQGDPDLAILGQVSNVHTSWSWRTKPLHLKSWKKPPAICEGRFRQVGWTLESLHLKKKRSAKRPKVFLKVIYNSVFFGEFWINLVFFWGVRFWWRNPLNFNDYENQPRPFEEFTRKSAQRRMQSIQVFGPFFGYLDFSWFISRWHDFHPLSHFGVGPIWGTLLSVPGLIRQPNRQPKRSPSWNHSIFFWSISKTRLLDRIQTQQQFMVHFHVPKRGRKTWQSCEPWTPNKRIWYGCDTQITLSCTMLYARLKNGVKHHYHRCRFLHRHHHHHHHHHFSKCKN